MEMNIPRIIISSFWGINVTVKMLKTITISIMSSQSKIFLAFRYNNNNSIKALESIHLIYLITNKMPDKRRAFSINPNAPSTVIGRRNAKSR